MGDGCDVLCISTNYACPPYSTNEALCHLKLSASQHPLSADTVNSQML